MKASSVMFNRIVVPLDGSAFAEASLAPACELARMFGSHISVVRALGASGLPRAFGTGGCQQVLDQLDDADVYLHSIIDRLRSAQFDADIALFIAEPGTAIARAAQVDHADLIVMTAHPRWRVDLLDNNSCTLQVLARSRVPILAWRDNDGVEQQRTRDVTRRAEDLASAEFPILVPLDGSPFAEEALPMAEDLARRYGSYLVLVRAVESSTPLGGEREREARAYLQLVKSAAERGGVGATAFVRRGSPAAVIDRVWREQGASLIVMASHGNTGICGSFLGSIAARTIEDVPAPVLVVRPALSAPSRALDGRATRGVEPPVTI